MGKVDMGMLRVAMPLLWACIGAVVFILSPASHQSFCRPLAVPIILSPEAPPAPQVS